MNMHAPALRRRLADIVEEYDAKRAAIPEALAAYGRATAELSAAACIGTAYGGPLLRDSSAPAPWAMEAALLKSAWRHVYDGLNVPEIAPAADKRRFEQMLEKPPAFTLVEIRERFGDYLLNPRRHILRGLAEVFCALDPAYRSHSKVKVGVAGLPKRVILRSVGDYGAWGTDRLRDVLNALAAYQRLPLVTWPELRALLDDGEACLAGKEVRPSYGEPFRTVSRGIRLRRFANGNGHLFFEEPTLRDINRALAEWYGDVLPDVEDDAPARSRPGTAVARDLQYYPTPAPLARRIVDGLGRIAGDRVLEPSCGCGRLLDALRDAGAKVFGIEVDPARAAESRAKGHSVQRANFLETVPTGDYDRVVMNPPFYGTHYASHVEHALRYLHPNGVLTAILPATARYDHGLLSGSWEDLPVGAFSASGTNVNTCILTLRRPPDPS